MSCLTQCPSYSQAFVNRSFENITSTEHALNLLAQFQAIMQRETLQQDLENKYQVIFGNYSRDLETVQKLYEKHKYEPPVPRNAPPVAGNIMWSRQLLRRIEQPMQQFSQNKNLMGSKEAKKVRGCIGLHTMRMIRLSLKSTGGQRVSLVYLSTTLEDHLPAILTEGRGPDTAACCLSTACMTSQRSQCWLVMHAHKDTHLGIICLLER